MLQLRTSVLAIACLVGLAACTSSTPSAQAPAASSTAGASGTPSSSPSHSASTAATPSAAATTSGPQTLDPCRLLTIQEASQIFGASLTATQRGSDGTSCTYSAGTTSVTITVHQAPDAAAARQGLQDAIAKIKQTPGATSTELSGIGDAAYETSVTVAGRTVAGIDGVKGTVLFTVGGQPNLADAALRQAALTLVGRL